MPENIVLLTSNFEESLGKKKNKLFKIRSPCCQLIIVRVARRENIQICMYELCESFEGMHEVIKI